jgi:hypothetical protein
VQIIHQCETQRRTIKYYIFAAVEIGHIDSTAAVCVGALEWRLVLAISGFPDPEVTTANTNTYKHRYLVDLRDSPA